MPKQLNWLWLAQPVIGHFQGQMQTEIVNLLNSWEIYSQSVDNLQIFFLNCIALYFEK